MQDIQGRVSTSWLHRQQTEPWPGPGSPLHEAPVCAGYWAPPHRSPGGQAALRRHRGKEGLEYISTMKKLLNHVH